MRILYAVLFYSFTHLVMATPIPSIKIVTAPEVKFMVEKEDVLLVHSLSQIEYEFQHIPGSINIPVIDMDTTDKLPKDKSKKIIFYCMGLMCPYSEKAAKKAAKMGYTNLFWFKGGIPEWYRFNYPMEVNKDLLKIRIKRLSPKKVNKMLKNGEKISFLDVRPLWWKEIPSFIQGSQFIPLVELHKRYKEIKTNHKIIIVDGFMKQSPTAARFLISKGYPVSGVLKGGMIRWVKEGYPVVKPEKTR